MIILLLKMKTALIILVHDPVPYDIKSGKTNIITEEESNAMHKQLLMHTHRVTVSLSADKFLFINNSSIQDDIWMKSTYIKRLQRGRSFGEIISNAFEAVFSMGYTKVVMIGSDSIEIESNHIDHAFNNLKNFDVVIGPAQEGGYYLIGMKKMHHVLFKNKAWNTTVLLQQTLHDIAKLGLTYHLQQALSDVEEEKEKYLFQHRQ